MPIIYECDACNRRLTGNDTLKDFHIGHGGYSDRRYMLCRSCFEYLEDNLSALACCLIQRRKNQEAMKDVRPDTIARSKC